MSCYSEKEKKEQKTKQTTTTTKNPKPNKPNKTPNQNNNKKIFLILWKKKNPEPFLILRARAAWHTSLSYPKNFRKGSSAAGQHWEKGWDAGRCYSDSSHFGT